jgi:hypothetical protein
MQVRVSCGCVRHVGVPWSGRGTVDASLSLYHTVPVHKAPRGRTGLERVR